MTASEAQRARRSLPRCLGSDTRRHLPLPKRYRSEPPPGLSLFRRSVPEGSPGEGRGERPEGLPAVADAVLLLVGELGHRASPPLRLALGHERGVVPEASLAARRPVQTALADSLGVQLAAVRPRDRGHAPVTRRPELGEEPGDCDEQLLEVLLV